MIYVIYIYDICFDILKLCFDYIYIYYTFDILYYISDMRYMRYMSIICISTIMYVYVFDQHDFVL